MMQQEEAEGGLEVLEADLAEMENSVYHLVRSNVEIAQVRRRVRQQFKICCNQAEATQMLLTTAVDVQRTAHRVLPVCLSKTYSAAFFCHLHPAAYATRRPPATNDTILIRYLVSGTRSTGSGPAGIM